MRLCFLNREFIANFDAFYENANWAFRNSSTLDIFYWHCLKNESYLLIDTFNKSNEKASE